MIVPKPTNGRESGSAIVPKRKIEYFDSNELLDAYLRDREEEARTVNRSFLELLKRNLRDTKKFIESLAKRMSQLKITFHKLYVRISSDYTIAILAVISEKDYISTAFLSVYNALSELEDEYNNESLTINFSFMPKGEVLNEEEILNDGFIESKHID